MFRIRQLYQQLPSRLRNGLEILVILLGLLAFVILGELAKDGVLLAAIAFFGLGALILGYEPVQKWRARRHARKIRQQREEWVRSQLGHQSWKEAIASAPYDYGRDRGIYLISRKGTSDIVAQVWSEQDAELWILEHTISQANQKPEEGDRPPLA